MKLYKNVDLCDLKSILKNGILSANKCKNYNWEDGNRAKNSYDVVYLFKPITKNKNVFIQYGLVLLEVEVKNAKKSDFLEGDKNFKFYEEYIISEVLPSQITNIYIPKIFKNRIKKEISKEIFDRISWCDTEFEEEIPEELDGKRSILRDDKYRIIKFAKECHLNTTNYHFLSCFLEISYEIKKTIYDFYDFWDLINKNDKEKEKIKEEIEKNPEYKIETKNINYIINFNKYIF